jgi:hypothetical protein
MVQEVSENVGPGPVPVGRAVVFVWTWTAMVAGFSSKPLPLGEGPGLARRQLNLCHEAVDLGRLGMLLAALSDAAELANPGSLSDRMTAGGNHGADGRWQYVLIDGRYPHGSEIVSCALIRLPSATCPRSCPA